MKNEDLALDYEKSEDPAKITYSIPASRSSTWTKTQVLPRFLPRLRELLTKNPDQDLESCESRLSDTLTVYRSSMGRKLLLLCSLLLFAFCAINLSVCYAQALSL